MPGNGLMIIHGNHLENLTQVTLQWLRDNPLPPLATEYILVQSNGMADWLKLQGAQPAQGGISAAQHYQMPARFLWQLYRWVLGENEVPTSSPFDKSRLEWRLFRLLPSTLTEPGFESLQHYLAQDPQQQKLFGLARQLADLYDQYQVYRDDWLLAWENGHEVLIDNRGQQQPLPEEQRWQARLWQKLAAEFPDTRSSARHHVRARCLEALRQQRLCHPLPQRLVIFGISTLAASWIELFRELANHMQILWLVQNPCQYYWGDSIEDRDLLRFEQRRHPNKPALAGVSALALQHGNPLLAAWGKQGRDTIGLLYEQDQPEDYRGAFSRIDLFDDADTFHPLKNTLLATLQQDILDLEPLPATPQIRAHDQSLRFHQSHSRQREVEILHDQLLATLEHSANSSQPLQYRDIVIMVPRIEDYAPHIEAVFGRYPTGDARYLPYAISDRTERQQQPAVLALEQLLGLAQSRITASDVTAWLDVPAIQQRFGLQQDDIPLISHWIRESGIRWGLHQAHREQQDIGFSFSENSWWFGLKRMLLGYATGATPADNPLWQGIAPYDEVAGLQASVAGKLVRFIEQLEHYWQLFRQNGNPLVWIERFQALLADFFLFRDETEQALEQQLLAALEDWRQATTEARFAEPIDPQVAKESWLERLDNQSLSQRFLVGRINFCTLMPMRNIPFRFVGLLGMNDGDYPRIPTPQEFDLTRRPGQYRPGDRSARDDDRYLLLEALLACRETLYISWQGRSVRDNTETPPSVLIGQLLDYIDQRWQTADHKPLSTLLTHEHPLQPFSRRYFSALKKNSAEGASEESATEDFTYAKEWQPAASISLDNAPLSSALATNNADTLSLNHASLVTLLKYPAELFFRERLQVRAANRYTETEDDEPFALDGLQRYFLTQQLIQNALANPENRPQQDEKLAMVLRQSGQLPVGTLGDDILHNAREALSSRWPVWEKLTDGTHPLAAQELDLLRSVQGSSIHITDWLKNVSMRGDQAEQLAFSEKSLVHKRNGKNIAPKFHNLIEPWAWHLLACANGLPLTTQLVSLDGQIRISPLEHSQALQHLDTLLALWLRAFELPLPMAVQSGTALLLALSSTDKPAAELIDKQRDIYQGSQDLPGEVQRRALLARAYPDYDSLTQAASQHFGDFAALAQQLYQPLISHTELV